MTIKSPLLVALTILCVSASSDALAGQPWSYCIGYHDLIEVVDCGDFSVMDDAQVYAHVKDFCDKDGNLIRSHVKLTALDDFYRDDDPNGTHATGTAHLNDRAMFDEWGLPQWTPADIFVGVHMSGLGIMFLDVGVLDLHDDRFWHVHFSADRFADWTAADFEALCDHFE